jgi:hypothetical protein
LAATIAATDVPLRAAMRDTVSPEVTVCDAATGAVPTRVAAAAAGAPDGMVSCWPIRIVAARASLFARLMAPTDAPVRAAIWLTVSPPRTTYCWSALAAPAAATEATASTRVAPVPATTPRRSRADPVGAPTLAAAASGRPGASGRAVAC